MSIDQYTLQDITFQGLETQEGRMILQVNVSKGTQQLKERLKDIGK